MNNYTINIPGYTIGRDALNQIGEVCKVYGTKVVIIGGKKALVAVQKKLEKVFAQNELEMIEKLWYGGECASHTIQNILDQLEGQEVDMVFGVGGGRALDTAKAVADQLHRPIFTVPTIASTCAATTKLSVVYNKKGVFEQFYFYDIPPTHVFIDTEVIAKAPYAYLRAGMGDTMAKHYECTFASRGKALDHNSGLAVAMSSMCVSPIIEYGKRALESAKEGQVSFELEQVVLANIITTGLVSMLIEEDYNGAVAHSLFYGLTLLPHIEESYLHGDVVGYGVLVQLMMDKQEHEVKKLLDFYKSVGIPASLEAIEVAYSSEILIPILEDTVGQPDMTVLPYEITTEMLFEAIGKVENLG